MTERQITSRLSIGSSSSAGETCELSWDVVYNELRVVAAREMARLGPGQTLQPTALVHEAYLRLAANGSGRWQSRAHFFGAAARAMRNVLVDHARARGRQRRGGDRRRVPISRVTIACEARSFDVLMLDEALTRLERYDARMGEVVMLRFFAGFTIPETARLIGVSPATVERDWSFARAWLLREVRGLAVEQDEL